jgi:hypothetical protein
MGTKEQASLIYSAPRRSIFDAIICAVFGHIWDKSASYDRCLWCGEKERLT